ncbi:amidase domain-containing protein [Arthrobacter sp. MMS18-M83]|uniref:amidase domain-containing protein n=1 Tax=Arthrobacter sp. MMS18-M83 TaxID=2996261 RepID=UPI00227A2A41|nr:amidase domain-containing protein [Arthrobacter sp. MMS18-M83]WAH98844.1 amidase domain-containing protein [Arthrobacter sp. MMS18-M83]
MRQKISAAAIALGITLVGIQPHAVFARDNTGLGQPAPPAAGASPAGKPGTESAAIQRVIERAIDRRNHQVVKGNPPAQADEIGQDIAADAVASTEQDYSKLHTRRDELETYGVAFIGSQSEIAVKDLSVTGAQASAVVTETTHLSYAPQNGTPSPDQIYVYEQKFDLVKTGAAWKIAGTRPTKPSPLLPTTVIGPADQSAPSGPSVQGSAHAKIYRDANGNPAPLPKELQHPKNLGPNGEPGASTSNLPQMTPSSMSKGSMTAPASSSVQAPMVASASYNYYDMIVYAATWFNGHNWQYNNYDGSTGDCTNFVSQALAAGGWQQVGSGFFWERTDSGKWYHSNPDSYTWSGAQNFFWFATGSGRTYELSYLADMGPADVMQIDWDNRGGIDHTALVTFVNGQDIKVSQHTDAYWNRSIWEIYNANQTSTYYALRT